MKKEQYLRYITYLQDHRGLASAIVACNRVLTALDYILYPLLLVLVFLDRRDLLLRLILVPGISFLALSAYRNRRNKPRPYETYGFTPLIEHKSTGNSFPSRHTFCFFMIGMCWLLYSAPVGIALLALGVVMGLVRIFGGVHYPVDVGGGRSPLRRRDGPDRIFCHIVVNAK